jgi:type I restriction enzyme, S subunit
MIGGLPEGWTWIRVGDLAASPQDITDGPFGSNLKTAHYTGTGPRVIRLQNIGDGAFIDEKAHIAPTHFERLRKHEVKPGDVIVAMLGEHLPRACLAPATLGPAIVKADCVRLRPNLVIATPKFVCAGLNSAVVREQGADLVHGVGRPRLGLKWFRMLSFPLAPLPEQERLVEAVDSYLSRLDDAVASLERIQARLKAYRASVLKAAVEGRLVPTEASLARAEKRDYEPAAALLTRVLKERRRRWEEATLAKLEAAGNTPKDDKWKAKYEQPSAPDISTLPSLPTGWCWATTDQIFSFVTSGSRGWAKYYSDSGATFIRIGNLDHDSISLDLSDIQHVSPPRGSEGTRTRVVPGDVLISITADVGMIGLVRDQVEEGYINQHISLARPVHGICIPYLAWFLAASDGGQKQLFALQRGATKVGLGLDDIRNVNVPLPPLSEQRWIVDEIERCFSVAADVEAAVSRNEVRSRRLRQAILKWAFQGKLVDQDPTDESANKILARIRAERAAAGPTKKTSRRRAKGAE